MELKRSLSYLTNVGLDDMHLWYVQMPKRGDQMPEHPFVEGNNPCTNDWVVNNKTALYLQITWDTKHKMTCDFHAGASDDPMGSKKEEINEDKQGVKDEDESLDGYIGSNKEVGMGRDLATAYSDNVCMVDPPPGHKKKKIEA
eukprot:4337553-Pyramimonas_sp.AAC.1